MFTPLDQDFAIKLQKLEFEAVHSHDISDECYKTIDDLFWLFIHSLEKQNWNSASFLVYDWFNANVDYASRSNPNRCYRECVSYRVDEAYELTDIVGHYNF